MWNFTRLYTMPLMTYKSCPGTCGLQVVPDLATAPGVVVGQRADLDLPHQARREVRGRHHGHLGRRQVRRRAHLRPQRCSRSARPTTRCCWAGTRRPTRARTRTGPRTSSGLTAVQTPNPTTIVFHLAHAVRGLQLRGRDPAVRPGAAEQGHRRELPAAPDVHRPVQVPELPAEQAAHAGAQHVLEPGHGPERQAAGQQDHRHHEHERQRHRQPAARGRPGRGHGRHRRAGRGAGQDPLLADAEGAVRQPDQRVPVVRLPQHQGGAAEQRALP